MKNLFANFGVVQLLVLIFCSNVACSKSKFSSGDVQSKVYHTWYVAATGSDVNKGTITAPFQTIGKALDNVQAGDTVLTRGGTYHEQLNITRSGLLGKNITIKAYPGERAIIDGSGMLVNGWMALITIKDVRYITLDGLEICNLTGTNRNSDAEGIAVNGNARDIKILNCKIYNIQSTVMEYGWRSAHAILAIGNGSNAITNFVIDGCEIHDIHSGTSETVTLAGNIDSFRITNNKVHDIENIGIIIAGGDGLNPTGNPAVNFARNGLVSNNEVYKSTHSSNPAFWGAGAHGAIAIYVCGGTGTIIERNKVYDSDRGIGLVSESNIMATKDCIVRNNFVYNCWRTGIYMGDYMNYTTGGTKNCYIINNTLFQNNIGTGSFGEIEGEIRLSENCVNNVVKNNLVYGRINDVFVHKYTSSGSGNVLENNLYYTTDTPQWIWNTTPWPGDVNYHPIPITDFNKWKTICGGDNNAVYGQDPQLMNISTPDLHIQSSSPAKNKGVIISEAVNGATDIDGKPRIVNGKISIGAQQ